MLSKQYTAQAMADRCMIIREVQNIVGKVAHCDMLADYDLIYPNFWSKQDDVCLGFNDGYFKGAAAVKGAEAGKCKASDPKGHGEVGGPQGRQGQGRS